MAAELVEAFAKDRINRRSILGNPVYEGPWTTGADGIRRRLLRFAPGTRFAIDYWERNDYGTTRWRVVVCAAITAGEEGTILPAVRPAALVLADVQGSTRVRAFLAWLAAKGDHLDRYSPAQWARIELHFQRIPLARLRAMKGPITP